MDLTFRKAENDEAQDIWKILQQAITRRKNDGSQQWQDGYPNPKNITEDIEKGRGYVLAHGNIIAGYTAIIINDEPAYENIQGRWLSNQDFIAVHRVAIADDYTGRALSKIILKHVEQFAVSHNIHSIKADTNFDNIAMMKTFDRMGYQYCGEVFLRGHSRRAYEKLLVNKL